MRQAEAFLAARCCDLPTATGDDLEEFMAHLLTRRSAHTAATRYKVLRIRYKCGALRAIASFSPAAISADPRPAPPSAAV